MSVDRTIFEADSILDELELLSRGPGSDAEFWRTLLTGLCALVQAKSSAVILTIQSQSAMVAHLGNVQQEYIDAWKIAVDRQPYSRAYFGEHSSQGWMAVPVRIHDAESGCLLMIFAAPIPESYRPGLESLVHAFSELCAARDERQRDRRLRESWELIERGNRQLSNAESLQELHQRLVDHLIRTCDAARVTLALAIPTRKNRPRLIASSGVTEVDPTSPVVKALEAIVAKALIDGKPILTIAEGESPEDTAPNHDWRGDDGVFKNHLVIGWDKRGTEDYSSWLVMEWRDRDSMTKALASIPQILSLSHSTWSQQARWCSLPARIRRRSNLSIGSRLLNNAGRYLKLAIGIGVLAALVWGAMRPYPFDLESSGVLQPISKRYIHASADGFLAELLVEDGDRVSLGQSLARLRSPSLDLQFEEVLGQIRAIAEKRNGLGVAINQLSPSSQDSLATQTRISTELLLLDTQEKHAREKLEFLKREQDRLILTSPIDGVVVARELKKELENRPLKRGDSLFQVVDLEGDWRLQIDVADRDSGYVDAYYAKELGEIEFVFDSLPSERFRGTVSELANVAENRYGTGVYRSVFANVDREAAARAHMGATAQVTFSCGDKPFWFVWSRPLIELLQKRFRLFIHHSTTIRGE